MADAWGGSWGSSWGSSWGFTAARPVDDRRPSGSIRRRPFWWLELQRFEVVQPTEEELEAAERVRAAKRQRVADLAAELHDQAERKELTANARNRRAAFDDRFSNAFKLAQKDGFKWRN